MKVDCGLKLEKWQTLKCFLKLKILGYTNNLEKTVKIPFSHAPNL